MQAQTTSVPVNMLRRSVAIATQAASLTARLAVREEATPTCTGYTQTSATTIAFATAAQVFPTKATRRTTHERQPRPTASRVGMLTTTPPCWPPRPGASTNPALATRPARTTPAFATRRARSAPTRGCSRRAVPASPRSGNATTPPPSGIPPVRATAPTSPNHAAILRRASSGRTRSSRNWARWRRRIRLRVATRRRASSSRGRSGSMGRIVYNPAFTRAQRINTCSFKAGGREPFASSQHSSS